MRPSACRGVSTLELAVTIVVIAILAAGFSTAIYSTTEDARKTAVLHQLEALKKAIIGEPRIVPAGERDLRRYGYIGDIGSLPPNNNLSVLTNPGSLPMFTVDADTRMGVGWRGPYVATAPADYLTDPWGNGIVFTVASGTSALTGAQTVATLRSLGPDGVVSSDDSYVEIYRSEAFSTVLGYVRDQLEATIAGIKVTLTYAVDGVKQELQDVTNSDGLYQFDDVPQGERVLTLSPKLSFVRDTGLTSGVDRNDVEFEVENLGRYSTTVNRMRITEMSASNVDFTNVLIDYGAGDVSWSGTATAGTTIPFTIPAVAGTGVAQEPISFFEASGLIMIVPDAIVGTIGSGGKLTIYLTNFETVGTNNNADMTGVTFTVEFGNTSDTYAGTDVFDPRNENYSKTLFRTKRKI